jgi:hypothetical protein
MTMLSIILPCYEDEVNETLRAQGRWATGSVEAWSGPGARQAWLVGVALVVAMSAR